MYQYEIKTDNRGLQSQAVASLGQIDADLSISERYEQIKENCIERFGPEFCNAVLPVAPIWLPPPERGVETGAFGLSWYVWAIIGFVMGKVL